MDTEGNRTRTARWTWLRPGQHPGWLWPVAVLLGFPIGGLIADLVVDGVDSAGTALVAGLIAGVLSSKPATQPHVLVGNHRRRVGSGMLRELGESRAEVIRTLRLWTLPVVPIPAGGVWRVTRSVSP